MEAGETSKSTKVKLVIVGDGAVGKTSLLIVYCNGEFPQDYIPTVFETYTVDIQIDNKDVELSLWDTAGQEDYDRLRPISYVNINVVVMCFSIDNPESLDNALTKWAPEMAQFCPGVPDVIQMLAKIKQAPVTPEQGRDLAYKINAHTYMECSAKTNDGVKDMFDTATRAALYGEKGKQGCPCVLV